MKIVHEILYEMPLKNEKNILEWCLLQLCLALQWSGTLFLLENDMTSSLDINPGPA